MKKQENELFFKYKGHPLQLSTDNISFDLPDGFVPQHGDIIEMMVSENASIGYVAHYVKVVCFTAADVENPVLDLASVDGRLVDGNGGHLALSHVYYNDRNGRKYIDCYAPEGSHVDFYPENAASYIINLIVHRTVGQVELYFL